jgi:hypothetical protein
VSVVPGFVGGSFSTRSRIASSERSINLFPEPIESKDGKSGAGGYLIGTPGVVSFDTLAPPGQNIIETLGRCFVISGGNVYEEYSTGAHSLIGNLNAYIGPVALTSNGYQLMIGCGLVGWTVNLAGSPVLTQITSPGFSGAGTVTYQDSYVIASVPGTREFFISGNNDATSWNGLDFASKDGAPDLLQNVTSTQRLLWLIGQETSEPWFNSGNANFPFQPVAGNLREVGTPAPMSPAVVEGELMWLAADKRGQGYVISIQNLYPVRISNFAMENEIQQYKTISDAIGESYQESGHTFYLLHFPTAGKTWAFDNITRLWHERGFWNIQTGSYKTALGLYHAYVFGKHLVLGANGQLYDQSLNYLDDAGSPLRRVRRFPHVSDENETIRHARLQIDLQRGTVPLGLNPQLILRYSDDGGFTWSKEKKAYVGKTGNYKYPRAIFRMLGSSRDRVYELVTTDAYANYWIAAYLNEVHGTETSG